MVPLDCVRDGGRRCSRQPEMVHLPSRRRLQHLTPFWGITAGSLRLQQEQRRAGKGVGVMYLDRPCPITTSNITSFNLYNTSIDPSGCYQAAIAAQVWAQLSFRGGVGGVWIQPVILPGDKDTLASCLLSPLSLDPPFLLIAVAQKQRFKGKVTLFSPPFICRIRWILTRCLLELKHPSSTCRQTFSN